MYLKFILTFVLGSAAFLACQAQKRSLLAIPFQTDLKQGTVQQFLEEIKDRGNVIIQYASNSFDTTQVVYPQGSELTVGALLRTVLQGQRVRLVEKNDKLILAKSSSVINTDDLLPVFTYFGFIRESGSREPLIGATVYEPSTAKGVTTNAYGYFSLSLPEGRHLLTASYVGYNQTTIDIFLDSDKRRDLDMTIKEDEAVMQMVVVSAADATQKTGGNKIGSSAYDAYNYMMGENDPLRSAYLLPGVQNIPRSFSGMFVRGGGADENLFLMDGNIVYNPTHMQGALSIVDRTSVKSMVLYKSDFPSKYGGAVSSVVDVHTKEGNMEQWKGDVNVGTLAGSVTLEGPVVKNNTAIMGSFRHSWSPPLLKLFRRDVEPDFYDIHFKATQVLNESNKLLLSFYNGQDELKRNVSRTENFNKWGNLIGSVMWNRVIGSRSFVNTSANMSRYKALSAVKYTFYEDDEDEDRGEDDFETRSVSTLTATEQYNIKSQAELFLSYKAKLNLGTQLAHTIIRPSDVKIAGDIEEDEDNFVRLSPLPFDELSAYGEAELKFGRLFIRPGLHFSVYQFRKERFYSFQPRFFASYNISTHHQVYTSYNRMTQYLHLVTNPLLGINTDIWLPSTGKLKPEESESYNLGYSYRTEGWKISLEGYWRELNHATNYAEGGSQLVDSKNWEQSATTGRGTAYGAEAMLQKTSGKLSFLATYALAWSWRQFDDINNGKRFPYKYDRRHSINMGVGYKLIPRLEISALWTFATGDAFTLPDFIYPDFDQVQRITTPGDSAKNGQYLQSYSHYNNHRGPHYQRLDAAISFYTQKDKNKGLMITAGVYNLLRSADQYLFEIKNIQGSGNQILESGYKTFDITPYVSLTFKF